MENECLTDHTRVVWKFHPDQQQVHTYTVHTYILNKPRSRETMQDTKTVSDEIEKGAKINK